jgi:hypothetical protein
VGKDLTLKTYEDMTGHMAGPASDETSAQIRIVSGNITSYDLSVGKGKICIASERHQLVNFELINRTNRTGEASKLIAENLSENAKRNQDIGKEIIYFEVREYRNSSGQLKKYKVLRVSSNKELLDS